MKFNKSLLFFAILLSSIMFVSCNNDEDDVDMPSVASTNPDNNSIDISQTARVEFIFSSEMDPQTINNTTVILLEGNTQVEGTVSYTNKTATFTPTEILAYNTIYTASVNSGAKNMLGESLAKDYITTFTTEGVIDNMAPEINSTNPLNNAADTPRNQTISIIFSESMDSATIDATTFTLFKGTSAVTGTVAYADNTATFTPEANLESNMIYTAMVSTGAMDLHGNGLVADTSWSFTTSGTSALLGAVDLGGASNYVILAKTAINNSSTSAIEGDLGLSPAATSYITGLSLTDSTGYATSAQVTGNVYAADMADPTPITLTSAVNDMITAYDDAAGRPTPDFVELGTGNIGGMTLTSGLYKWTSTVTIPTDVTLTGSADDIWIFQIAGDLTQSSAINVVLSGGAQAKNVFWQVSGEATFGANSHFEGNILSMTGITFQTGASINGRALAQTAVILDANAVTKVQ